MTLKTDTISQTVKRPKYKNSKLKKPSFEDETPKNRHDFANSEKAKKYQNSKNQKIPKIQKTWFRRRPP